MKELRAAILRMRSFGDSMGKIAKDLRISKVTVQTAIEQFGPNSPDLNPLDYSIWSILEEKACQKPHPNVESLKRALKKAWKEISLETLEKIVDNFPKRLKACVDANGGHFE